MITDIRAYVIFPDNDPMANQDHVIVSMKWRDDEKEWANYFQIPRAGLKVLSEAVWSSVPKCTQNGAGEGNRTLDQQLGNG